ncbi:hypothetical protein STEG23_001628 [Scotinomys teguina]
MQTDMVLKKELRVRHLDPQTTDLHKRGMGKHERKVQGFENSEAAATSIVGNQFPKLSVVVKTLLDHKEKPMLRNQNPEQVITTKDENLKQGYDQRSLSNGSVFMVLQRPEALNQTNDSWQ